MHICAQHSHMLALHITPCVQPPAMMRSMLGRVRIAKWNNAAGPLLIMPTHAQHAGPSADPAPSALKLEQQGVPTVQITPQHAVLASNTSSISITRLAAATVRPDRVVGLHFMNPVPVMGLVELVRGMRTSDQVRCGGVAGELGACFVYLSVLGDFEVGGCCGVKCPSNNLRIPAFWRTFHGSLAAAAAAATPLYSVLRCITPTSKQRVHHQVVVSQVQVCTLRSALLPQPQGYPYPAAVDV
jgi:hypothetical protein